MKKKLTVVFALMAILVLFCSCGGKKYNGFKVEGDFIILPLPEEGQKELGSETIRVPLCAYKTVEATMEPLIDDITAFKPISEKTLDKYYDYEDTIEAEFEKQVAAAKIDPEKLGASMTEIEMMFVDEFMYLPEDYAWEVAYALEELNDFVAGDSWYYDTVKEVFEEETSDILEYDSMLKLWFPQFTYISTYEATTYAKENPNAGKASSLSDLYEDALDEYEDIYEDALNEYSDYYDEALDLYGDYYDDALDLYGDAYSDALDALNSYYW